jgi:hypothetical protein
MKLCANLCVNLYAISVVFATLFLKSVYMNHTKTSPYSLDDTSNYNYILQNTVVECFTNYVEIINAYILHCKNIHTLNNTLYTYLLEKGMSTISHIFKLMILFFDFMH